MQQPKEVNIEKQPLLRFIVMGRKSLPDPSKRSRPYWGFVEIVTTKVEDIKTALKGGTLPRLNDLLNHTSKSCFLNCYIYT